MVQFARVFGLLTLHSTTNVTLTLLDRSNVLPRLPPFVRFFVGNAFLFARFTGGAVFESTHSSVRGPNVFHFCPRRPVVGLHLLLLLVRTAHSSYRTVNAVQYGDH